MRLDCIEVGRVEGIKDKEMVWGLPHVIVIPYFFLICVASLSMYVRIIIIVVLIEADNIDEIADF
jgi:hypothetical protein